jgi:hypothetical protein
VREGLQESIEFYVGLLDFRELYIAIGVSFAVFLYSWTQESPAFRILKLASVVFLTCWAVFLAILSVRYHATFKSSAGDTKSVFKIFLVFILGLPLWISLIVVLSRANLVLRREKPSPLSLPLLWMLGFYSVLFFRLFGFGRL